MIYGKDFFCLGADGQRLAKRTYPRTEGFEYADGTGDCGEMLLRTFAIELVLPDGTWVRMRIRGDDAPKLHENSFDFDWASLPAITRSALTCDKADYRIRTGSLFHDMGFCVKEFWPGFTMAFWNNILFGIMEAYSVSWDEVTGVEGLKAKAAMLYRYNRDKALRWKVWAGVSVGGPFVWCKAKDPEMVEAYRSMFSVERIG